MAIYENTFSRRFYRLFFLFLLCQSVSKGCRIVGTGDILNCSGLSKFPNGSLYGKIQTLNFHDNNFIELTAYEFKNHNFIDVEIIIVRQSNISHIDLLAFSDVESVRELDLYGNNLTYLYKNTFVGLEGLRYLNLGHNRLISIEEATFNPLKNLELLDLSFNNIIFLTPYLLKHTIVSVLYLSENKLEFTHDEPILESVFLSVLSLRSCKLRKLNKNSFRDLANLIYLDVSNNQLDFIHRDLLKPLKHLKQLDISKNKIYNLDIRMFPSPSKLEVLLCYENQLELNCKYMIEQLQTAKNTTINEISTKEDTNESKQHLYILLYCLSGIIIILFIIFFVEIFWFLRIRSRRLSKKSIMKTGK